MESTWKLRRALESDAEDLRRIEAACFGEPWSMDLLGEAVRDPKYLLLCAQSLRPADCGRLLGYAAAWSVLDEGQIDRLAVLPTQRRLGLGRALLRGVLRGLAEAGARTVFLEVRAGNAAAIELYAGENFHVAGTRRGYYEDGEDALVLRLESLEDAE